MVRLFKNCTSFNQPLENWNVSRVGFMTTMFEGCVAFNQDLSRWNVSRVINMMRMFRGCTSLTINPGWQINQETITTQMFLETPLQGTVLEAVQQQPAPRQPAPRQPAQQQPAQPQGLAWEVHNAFDDLDLPKFMTVIRRENNGDSNFKDTNNVLEPVISYINSSDTSLTQEQKTRYTTNFRKHRGIIENVNEYIRGHPEVKANTLEVIQFVLSQDPNYKDLYIETFENECMGGYSSGDRQSCTKGMFERIYMANKGTIEGLCFDELEGTRAAGTTCNPVYLELYSAFVPGSDIDINDIFQKWYNQFSYDAVPEGENPLTNLSVEARKQHFRDFVRQDEAITQRIWTNAEFQRKLEKSIQANNIIFETLTLDVGLGRKRRNNRRTVKKKKKKKQKQRKATMKRLKRKTKGRY
jgi:surface protein